MRLHKAFLFLLLAGAFSFSTGCSGCNGGGSGDPNKILIVSSLPRTGSAQKQTDSIVNGIKMAIEEYNGKVGDFNIEYLDWDDATAAAGEWTAEAENANAQNAAQNNDVMVYIGPYNSGAAKISMPILNQAGLLMISPACTWPGLTKPNVTADEPDCYRPAKTINFLRVVPTDDVQGPVGARFIKDDLKAKKVFILDDTQLYGKGVANLFEKGCKEIGLEVLGRESINVQSQEFAGLLARVKESKPDAIYFGGTSQTKAGQIAKDMIKVGLTCPIVCPDGCYEKAFIESAGAEALNGRAYVTFGGKDPSKLEGVGKEFVEKYQKKYGVRPEAYAVYGYESAKAALHAIEKAGKKDRSAILEAAKAIKDFEKGAVGKWSFDENGDTTQQIFTISKVENGDFKPVKEVNAAAK